MLHARVQSGEEHPVLNVLSSYGSVARVIFLSWINQLNYSQSFTQRSASFSFGIAQFSVKFEVCQNRVFAGSKGFQILESICIRAAGCATPFATYPLGLREARYTKRDISIWQLKRPENRQSAFSRTNVYGEKGLPTVEDAPRAMSKRQCQRAEKSGGF
ncbi:hypothetical protein K0M31_017350 [Melipona bicolor]|uniref:Uncharacterized protein n=1 Tax=Melipona bicolor TaxID=60889 RepID=A0AA40KSF8_9HYME|nr:hypothetical protein K0M31_017350 [Melipona bicolor]